MSTLLGEHFATDENGSFLSWLESATRTASMAQTPITRKLRFRLRISHERSYGQSVLMKESTAFLILSWLSTPQSESGLESVTTRITIWGLYEFNKAQLKLSIFQRWKRSTPDWHSLAKFLPMVLHPLSYWSWQYCIPRSVSCSPPPVFFWAVLCTGGYANVHITSSTDIPAQEKRSRQPVASMGGCGSQNMYICVHATKTP